MHECILFFERLRFARGFTSQEKFVEGVCDARQYRRYLSGQSKIPSEVFILLIERLKMNFEEVINYYTDTFKQEKQEVQLLYSFLMRGNFNQLDIQFSNHNKKNFIAQTDQMLYTFCVCFYEYKSNQISAMSYIDKVKKLINFDELLHYFVLSIHEMLILSNIMKALSDKDSKLVANKLSDSIENFNITDINSIDCLFIVIYELAIFHGKNKNYEEALTLCDLSIRLSKQYHHFYLLAHFYYLKALYLNILNKTEERDHNIHCCIHALEIDSNHTYKNKLIELINNKFHIDNINEFELFYLTAKKG